ncbi:MAG TPA: cytochrome c biogenesis protein ResB [Geopsychrobacteraceae bacterium]|nr:cytochrome c biogenesis protein ResB [Geopsychrobacteraceae bacterium]
MIKSIWNLLCSLKLAIYLASIATLLLMGGSLLVPFHHQVFGNMDQVPFGQWLAGSARNHLPQSWWFHLASLAMLLFGINTLCCFLDWLLHIKSRWRKSGEYLLHLGVVLVLIAYVWGSAAGWRNSRLQIPVGGSVMLADWPGYSLRLDDFQPVFGDKGPPQDMISDVTILNGQTQVIQAQVSINSPLLHGGLVVTPVSFAQAPVGLRFSGPRQPSLELTSGDQLELPSGSTVRFDRFVPDVRRQSDGRLEYRDDRLGTPAYEISIKYRTGGSWQGWYFPTRRIPRELMMTGFDLRPVAPLYQITSILTVNYDPGAPLAAAGGALMSVGVLISLFSFYRKRTRQDRPEV